MIKTARQLKDLIRNLSREKSADAQILMRNYMMERFLERISLSEYRDKFILKGGITRTTTNTRMRDFYDIYILEQLHGTTLNPKILHDALLATAHKRGSEKYLNQAEEVFDEVENDSVMQKLWEAYRKKFSYASDLEWDVIMKVIRRLYVLCEKGISL